jgi:hypothetical protein
MIFTFLADKGDHRFKCRLKTRMCGCELASSTQNTKNGNGAKTCRNMVTMGGPYCQLHLESKMGLRIADSTVPQAGRGVFAWRPHSSVGPVFKAGQAIVDYTGEVINQRELDKRYGTYTAPYAIMLRKDRKYIDGACDRGVASMINGSYGPAAKKVNVRFVTSRDRKSIYVEAMRDIYHGEELFADYGSDYRYGDGKHYTSR